MASKPRLTNKERGRIDGLHEAGFGIREMARRTAHSTHIIRRVVNVEDSRPTKCLGSPPMLSERDLRRLVRTAASGEHSAAQLRTELGLSVSVRTVQRVLAQTDWFVYENMVNTLPLNVKQARAWHGPKPCWYAKMPEPSGIPLCSLTRKSGTWTAPTASKPTGATCTSRSDRPSADKQADCSWRARGERLARGKSQLAVLVER